MTKDQKTVAKLVVGLLVLLSAMIWFSLSSCATQQINVTRDTTVKAESTSNISVKPTKAILGVNGQIDFNRVSYNNVPFQIAEDSMHLDAVRYPGGTVSQQFNYLTDTPSLYSLAMANNYCKIKTTFFVLNMTTSTLDAQVRMLLLAHNLGLFTDTLRVELNNEYVSAHDDVFLDKCVTWSNFLKSQLPFTHVLFGIPGGAPKKWNDKVLNRLPDAYLVDHYHNPNDYTKNGITDTVAIDQMMRADKRNYFAGIPASKIWITEFNLQTDKNVTPAFANDEQKEIAVKFMYKWFASRGFAAVLFHNIVMASGNGAIISDGRGSYLSPTGIAVRDFIASQK